MRAWYSIGVAFQDPDEIHSTTCHANEFLAVSASNPGPPYSTSESAGMNEMGPTRVSPKAGPILSPEFLWTIDIAGRQLRGCREQQSLHSRGRLSRWISGSGAGRSRLPGYLRQFAEFFQIEVDNAGASARARFFFGCNFSPGCHWHRMGKSVNEELKT